MPATPTLEVDRTLDPLHPDGPDPVLVDTILAGYRRALEDVELHATWVTEARDRFYALPRRRPPELDTLAEFLDAEATRYVVDLIGAHTHAPFGNRGNATCPACSATKALRHAASIARRWPDA